MIIFLIILGIFLIFSVSLIAFAMETVRDARDFYRLEESEEDEESLKRFDVSDFKPNCSEKPESSKPKGKATSRYMKKKELLNSPYVEEK